MKSKFIAIVIVLLTLGTVAAQEPDETFAGFVNGIRANAVKGEVVYQRNNGSFPLEPGLQLAPGDVIKTSPAAYAEVLLQPGNYLRLAADTELQVVNDQRDRMRLKLNRGTISIEMLSKENFGGGYYNTYEGGYLVRVLTPGAGVFIMDPGIYRINTTPSEQTELIAREGSAVIEGREIKAKRRAVASHSNVTIMEIDAKNEDAFDLWARERADTLVRANKALRKTPLWSKKRKEGEETPVDFPKDAERNGSALVVFAKPGAVIFADDGVEFRRTPAEWQPLTETTHLDTGDSLRTPANSFTELMLFPDMHLRVAESSEVVFEQLSNDAVSIKVLSGSAILDAARFDRKEAPQITIANAATTVAIANSGNYRIDAGKITVREGKVTFKERTVGSCRTITGEVVSDCDKKHQDNFDYWSHYRGEGELERGLSMASFLTKSRRDRFQNTGFWFQEPGSTSYTFVPFSSELFRSPYGGNYSTVLSPRRRLNPGNMDGFRPQRLPSQNPTQP
jgi:hypothetical protein